MSRRTKEMRLFVVIVVSIRELAVEVVEEEAEGFGHSWDVGDIKHDSHISGLADKEYGGFNSSGRCR